MHVQPGRRDELVAILLDGTGRPEPVPLSCAPMTSAHHLVLALSYARCLIEAERDWVLGIGAQLGALAKSEPRAKEEDEHARHRGL